MELPGEDPFVILENVRQAVAFFHQRFSLPDRTPMWVTLPDSVLGRTVAARIPAPHVPRLSDQATQVTAETGDFTFYVVPIGWDALTMRLARAGLSLPPGVTGEGIIPGH